MKLQFQNGFPSNASDVSVDFDDVSNACIDMNDPVSLATEQCSRSTPASLSEKWTILSLHGVYLCYICDHDLADYTIRCPDTSLCLYNGATSPENDCVDRLSRFAVM
jgi:hypothetical protein